MACRERSHLFGLALAPRIVAPKTLSMSSSFRSELVFH